MSTYAVTLMNLKSQCEDRRVYGPHIGSLGSWTIMPITTNSTEALTAVVKHTTGRFYLGIREIAFENAVDATAFKLGS